MVDKAKDAMKIEVVMKIVNDHSVKEDVMHGDEDTEDVTKLINLSYSFIYARSTATHAINVVRN